MSRSISKRVRFEIFKRDGFACQYCGQTPPAIVLEVDHIIAVAEGGSNELHNLLTACFDCNRGKGAVALSNRASPPDIRARRDLIKERVAQAKAYDELLRKTRAKEDAEIDRVIGIYEAMFDGYTLADRTRPSIRQFLRLLPWPEVEEAMEIACSRRGSDWAFKYFCGICWRKLEDRR